MSFYNYSRAGNRGFELPQSVFPSSHRTELRTSYSARPAILQTLSSNSADSALSASTAATSVSASSVSESIEEAMSTALFGVGGYKKSPTLSSTSTHPSPWNDNELLRDLNENHPPPHPRKTTKPKHKNPITRFSTGSNAWETDSSSSSDIPTPTPTKKPNERGKSKPKSQKTKNPPTKEKRKRKPKVQMVEDITEEASKLDLQTERLMNIRFEKSVAGRETGCALGIEGLKGLQNIQGPHQKGEYFKGMREWAK